jgi:hypothetical protein
LKKENEKVYPFFKPIKNFPLISDTMSLKQLALIISDFKGESSEELTVKKNDVVTFVRDEGDGWAFVELEGREGVVPVSFCKLLPKGLSTPQQVEAMRENVKTREGGTPPPKKKTGSVMQEKPQITHNIGPPKVIGAPVVKHTSILVDSFSDEEIEKKFEIVMTEMGMKDEKTRNNLRNQPKENKIRMITMHEDKKKQESGFSIESLISELRKEKVTPEFMKGCSQQLKSASVNYIVEFIKKGGIEAIGSVLSNTNLLNKQGGTGTGSRGGFLGALGFGASKVEPKKQGKDDPIQLSCLECVQEILNTEEGMEEFLQTKAPINSIVLILDTAGNKTRNISIFLLAAICQYSDQGLMFFLSLLTL